MSFREKSAWLMAISLGLASVAYGVIIASMSRAMGFLVPPLLPLAVVFTVVLAVMATVGHIFIALLAPKDAQASIDERDRVIGTRARSWSSYVFVAGVALSLGLYLLVHNGDVLFYGVFSSWVLAQISEYAFEIVFYRSAI